MVSVCTSSFKELFSFKLFGIFVNVSNEKPPLHKAGGTLAVSLTQNCEYQRNLKMNKEIWRENWLISINELTDYNLQQKSWLNKKTKNPHWSFIEFMCSYFDDLFLQDGYEQYLKINWVTDLEYSVIKDWHNKLDKYKSPSENDWADDLILNDTNWIGIVKLGEITKQNLLHILSRNEKEILEKNLISEIQ
jgi:hypothetical protein